MILNSKVDHFSESTTYNFSLFFRSWKTSERGGEKQHQRKAVADAGATARGAIAITRNDLEAANGINIRELKQRDASRVEAAEVKSSLEALPSDARSSEGMLSYRSACPEFKDSLGINMTMKLSLLSGQ